MKKLLIVGHTPSNNTQLIANAMLKEAQHAEPDALKVELLSPFSTFADNILLTDGIMFLTPENFGYMSGALKDMFDRNYYPCLESTRGLPWCMCVRAGKDGSGTVRAVKSIASGLAWREIQAPLILKGDFREGFIASAREFSATFAVGLAAGIF